jgi:uncharacterized protein (DUF1330 family)
VALPRSASAAAKASPWRSSASDERLNAKGEQVKGYLVGNIVVRDHAVFESYGQKVAPVIAAFGGRYIIRGGAIAPVERDLPIARLVIVEFPSMADLRRFYDSPEYAPLLQMRIDSTTSNIVFVEGYDAP